VEVAGVAIGYAVGPIILARRLNDLPNIGVIALSLAVCTIAYAPVFALQLPAHVPSGRAVASIVTLALVCTALAFVVFFALVAETGPVRATVITYVNRPLPRCSASPS
jgi:drug/metabolite transporter (DMT)-like permease